MLIASCGFIVYDKFLKKDDNNSIQDTMTNELAISVAKEKLYEANHYFGFDSFMCDKDRIKDDFYCYYGSLENWEDKFYEIYKK